MPIYKIKLLERKEVALNTILCRFEKPADFHFVAGQYAGFTLPSLTPTVQGGNTRRFSLLSSPEDPFLTIATRIQQSIYKQTLLNLEIGSEIKMAGPSGNFILHEDENIPAVMLAGGIGISPFFSMINSTYKMHSKRNITLIYGNESKKTAAFLDELAQIEMKDLPLKVINVFNQLEDITECEQGYITSMILKKYVKDFSIPIFYVCGSPAFVTYIKELLQDLNINETQIKIEDFPGY